MTSQDDCVVDLLSDDEADKADTPKNNVSSSEIILEIDDDVESNADSENTLDPPEAEIFGVFKEDERDVVDPANASLSSVFEVVELDAEVINAENTIIPEPPKDDSSSENDIVDVEGLDEEENTTINENTPPEVIEIEDTEPTVPIVPSLEKVQAPTSCSSQSIQSNNIPTLVIDLDSPGNQVAEKATQQSFECKKCSCKYSNEKCLKKHIESDHNFKVFECIHCSSVVSFDGFAEHNSSCKTLQPYQEPRYKGIDDIINQSQYRLTLCRQVSGPFIFLEEVLGDLEHICKLCELAFTLKSTMQEHIYKVHPFKSLVCITCKRDSSLSNIMEHIFCQGCKAETIQFQVKLVRFCYKLKITSKSILPLLTVEKQRKPNKEVPFCELCNESFSIFTLFIEHLHNHHHIKEFCCEICYNPLIFEAIEDHMILKHRKPNLVFWSFKAIVKKAENPEPQEPKGVTMIFARLGIDKNREIFSLKIYSRDDNMVLAKCDICKLDFREISRWFQHIEEIHDSFKLYTCTSCLTVFQINNLRAHECPNSEKGALIFRSGKHQYSIVRQNDQLVVNIQELNFFQHDNFCFVCNIKNGNEGHDSLRRHLKSKHNIKFFKCRHCNVPVKFENFEEHILSQHKTLDKVVYSMMQCFKHNPDNKCTNFSLISFDGLRLVLKANEKTVSYECTLCKCKYGKKTNLQKHLATTHRVVYFKCVQCNVLISFGSIEEHMAIQHDFNEPNTLFLGVDTTGTKIYSYLEQMVCLSDGDGTDPKILVKFVETSEDRNGHSSFQCKPCQHCFGSQTFQKHLENKHKMSMFECSFCNISFKIDSMILHLHLKHIVEVQKMYTFTHKKEVSASVQLEETKYWFEIGMSEDLLNPCPSNAQNRVCIEVQPKTSKPRENSCSICSETNLSFKKLGDHLKETHLFEETSCFCLQCNLIVEAGDFVNHRHSDSLSNRFVSIECITEAIEEDYGSTVARPVITTKASEVPSNPVPLQPTLKIKPLNELRTIEENYGSTVARSVITDVNAKASVFELNPVTLQPTLKFKPLNELRTIEEGYGSSVARSVITAKALEVPSNPVPSQQTLKIKPLKELRTIEEDYGSTIAKSAITDVNAKASVVAMNPVPLQPTWKIKPLNELLINISPDVSISQKSIQKLAAPELNKATVKVLSPEVTKNKILKLSGITFKKLVPTKGVISTSNASSDTSNSIVTPKEIEGIPKVVLKKKIVPTKGVTSTSNASSDTSNSILTPKEIEDIPKVVLKKVETIVTKPLSDISPKVGLKKVENTVIKPPVTTTESSPIDLAKTLATLQNSKAMQLNGTNTQLIISNATTDAPKVTLVALDFEKGSATCTEINCSVSKVSSTKAQVVIHSGHVGKNSSSTTVSSDDKTTKISKALINAINPISPKAPPKNSVVIKSPVPHSKPTIFKLNQSNVAKALSTPTIQRIIPSIKTVPSNPKEKKPGLKFVKIAPKLSSPVKTPENTTNKSQLEISSKINKSPDVSSTTVPEARSNLANVLKSSKLKSSTVATVNVGSSPVIVSKTFEASDVSKNPIRILKTVSSALLYQNKLDLKLKEGSGENNSNASSSCFFRMGNDLVRVENLSSAGEIGSNIIEDLTKNIDEPKDITPTKAHDKTLMYNTKNIVDLVTKSIPTRKIVSNVEHITPTKTPFTSSIPTKEIKNNFEETSWGERPSSPTISVGSPESYISKSPVTIPTPRTPIVKLRKLDLSKISPTPSGTLSTGIAITNSDTESAQSDLESAQNVKKSQSTSKPEKTRRKRKYPRVRLKKMKYNEILSALTKPMEDDLTNSQSKIIEIDENVGFAGFPIEGAPSAVDFTIPSKNCKVNRRKDIHKIHDTKDSNSSKRSLIVESISFEFSEENQIIPSKKVKLDGDKPKNTEEQNILSKELNIGGLNANISEDILNKKVELLKTSSISPMMKKSPDPQPTTSKAPRATDTQIPSKKLKLNENNSTDTTEPKRTVIKRQSFVYILTQNKSKNLFFLKAETKKSIGNAPPPPTFYCIICKQLKISSYEIFKEHMEMMHSRQRINFVKCSICSTFELFSEFPDHFRMHSQCSKELYSCKLTLIIGECKDYKGGDGDTLESFSYFLSENKPKEYFLKAEIQKFDVQTPPTFHCIICRHRPKISSYEIFRKHMEMMHSRMEVKFIKCNVCSAFDLFSEFSSHFRLHSQESQDLSRCELELLIGENEHFPLSFKYNEDLKARWVNIKLSDKEESHCEKCKLSFNDINDFFVHFGTAHNSRISGIKCEKCLSDLEDLSELESHVKSKEHIKDLFNSEFLFNIN
ncbi:hypothetical protein ACFFRR_008885 [Megaselia abdita]